MLFELLLLPGITLAPVSFAVLLICSLFSNRIGCWIGIWMAIIAVTLLFLAVMLPPIPIIPQG